MGKADQVTNRNVEASAVKPIDVARVEVPKENPLVGQVVIAVTGTAVQLSSVPWLLPTSSIQVYALSGNGAAGAVGGEEVLNIVDGTGNGFILEAGQNAVIMARRLDDVWVNGTAGDIFTYSAG